MQFNYMCSDCGRNYTIDPKLTVCPVCGEQQAPDQPLRGVLDVELSGNAEKDFDVFDLLPVPRHFFPPIPVGNTPLWQPENLRRSLGFENLYIKDDGLNPTGSLKDRASFLVSAFAAQHGINEIVLASSGNAGSSMAGVAAAAGQQVTLFLPATAPAAKLVQALQYGATVHRVNGPYDDAYDLSLEYTNRFGGMNRSTAYNPMTLEGKKTVSLEIFQQLGGVPDYLFVASGDGCILSGVYKGFQDLRQLGLIDKFPTVIAVQAAGSDALYRAFQTGQFEARPTRTVADSICVNVPRNGWQALKRLQTHNGRVITVSDEEIIAAQARLSRTTGLFSEPAGAAAFAGFLKLSAELAPAAGIVILATGNGLKDSTAAVRGIAVPAETIKSLSDITKGT
ncbi:Threonine synthase (EC [Olavius sp. associated proteobacterium Delta 1]|nr:Threonine synthase (EC [Olavius sp. associated proteobacterium Delta 1]